MADDALGSIELFISHASEDKDELVRPLAAYLRRVGVKVWYDEFTLTAGDSLSRSIDEGLAKARYGLVVISPHFIQKRWPEYELRGLTAKEIVGTDKVILPIWHNISPAEILEFSPPLVDKFALVTAGLKVPEVAEGILRAIRPDLANRVSMLRALLRTAVYLTTAKRFELSVDERAAIVELLLASSIGYKSGIEQSSSRLPNGVAYHVMKSWQKYVKLSNQEKMLVRTTGD